MKEIWKDSPDGPWEVSNMGRMRIKRPYGRGRTCNIGREITFRVQTTNNKLGTVLKTKYGKRMIFLHRQVAQVFVPRPKGCSSVHFIDWNCHNCRADNLEWSTTPKILQLAKSAGRIQNYSEFPPEKIGAMRRDRKAGMTRDQIIAKYHCSKATCSKYTSAYCIHPKYKALTKADKRLIVRMRKQGYNYSEIARVLKRPPERVRRWSKRLGVAI